MLVMKFGGTSVGDAECFRKVKEIIVRASRERPPVAVVVSAMSAVTETLLEAARTAAAGDQKTVEQKREYLEKKHFQVADALFSGPQRERARRSVSEILAEFQKLCSGMALLGELPPRALDAEVSVGERLSATLLAQYLEDQGCPAQAVDARECLITDDNFGSARPLMDLTREAMRRVLLPLTGRGIVPVITGFLGATREGVRTTLGRGGSDYSAAIVAAALDAEQLWIWTDVDGGLSD